MTPNTTTPAFPEALRMMFDLRLRDVHVAIPATVNSYNADEQTVDATPQVMMYVRQEGDDVAKPVPRITRCPVLFPGAGGFRITFPIQEGDTVLLLFAESSLDKWLSNSGQVDPEDQRRHHWTDGIALPGLKPYANQWSGASTSGLTIGADGGPQLVFRKDMIELGGDDQNAPTDYVALASLVKSETQKVIDAVKSGFSVIKTNNQLLSAHTHEVVEVVATPSVSLAAMQDPSDPGDAGDVKSSVLKAK